MEQLNRMCTDCPHLDKACAGTDSKVWTGCILKEQDAKTAADYIARMESLLREGAQK